VYSFHFVSFKSKDLLPQYIARLFQSRSQQQLFLIPPSSKAMSSSSSPPLSETYTASTPSGDTCTITSESLDEAAILNTVKSVKAGAVCLFIGTTRDSFKGMLFLTLPFATESSACALGRDLLQSFRR
jgi:hypothetical protein